MRKAAIIFNTHGIKKAYAKQYSQDDRHVAKVLSYINGLEPIREAFLIGASVVQKSFFVPKCDLVIFARLRVEGPFLGIDGGRSPRRCDDLAALTFAPPERQAEDPKQQRSENRERPENALVGSADEWRNGKMRDRQPCDDHAPQLGDVEQTRKPPFW